MSIQSLNRAFDIMELVAGYSTPVPLKTIAEELNLPVSTIHNLVRTMVDRGYIIHVGARGGFTLGPELIELAESVPVHYHVNDIVKPYVLELYERCERESTYFSVLRKNQVITEIFFPGNYTLNVTLRTEIMDKLHCFAQGKLFLAHMSQQKLERYLNTFVLEKQGPHTIVDRVTLLKDLDNIRKLGYSINDEEAEDGACGIATPLFGAEGHMIGTFAVGLPTIRMNKKKEELIQTLLQITAKAQRELIDHFKVSQKV